MFLKLIRPRLRRGLLLFSLSIIACASTLSAQQPARQPAATEYIKILEDPHRVERMKIAEVIQALGIKPGDSVADIGSGSGLFTRPLARAVLPAGKVFAVDIDRELLAYVDKTAKEQDIRNLTIVLGESDSPKLAPRSVDLVLICDTLHHIEHREAYLKNVRPGLKPGGRLAIIDFQDAWPSNHDSMRFSLTDLQKWTDAAGYSKIADHHTIPGNFFHIYEVREQ